MSVLAPKADIRAHRTIGRKVPAADIRPSAAAGISTHSTAPEESFVRRVLLDIGGFPLFRCVGMMFMLHRLVFRHFRITPQTFLAAIGGRNGRHVTRHN